MNLLFLGDVMAKPGRRAVGKLLPILKEELAVDVVVANGENIAGGAGLTRETSKELFRAGVDVLTGGNHLFDKPEGLSFIREEPRVVRPANYPPGTPGNVLAMVDAPGGPAAVGSVLGRIFMRPLDDPFRAAAALVEEARARGARYFILDMHAEASSEKMAMGWYLDGKASVVAGSHTHVPTADERVLPGGTAYITDVGMTGPYDSVIGMEREPVIEHMLTGMRRRFKPATENVKLFALLVALDETTGLATQVSRITRRLEE